MNSLTNDILLEIFERLDENSLLEAMNVCQKWSQLITSSASLRKRFTLTLVVSNDQSFRVYGKIDTKNPQNLVIKSVFKRDALSINFFEHLKKYRETARNLALNDFQMSDVISTLKHLNLEKITKLVLIKCEFNLKRGTVIEMPNLSQLEVHSSIEFVTVIRVHCVKVLKVSNLSNHRRSYTQNDFEILNSFLNRCVALKELTLSKFNIRSVDFHLNIDQFKFNLVSLTVEDSLISNLQQFLLSQKNSLRNLAISCKYRDVQLLKAIFNDLELIQLEIGTAIMLNDFPFINKNTTIKKLTINNDDSNHYTEISHPVYRPRHTNNEQLNPAEDYQNSPRQLNEPPDWNHLHRHVSNRPNQPIAVGWDVNFAGRNIPMPFTKVRKIISICSAVEEFSNRDFDFSTESLLTQIHLSMANLKILKLSNVPKNIPIDVNFDKLQCLDIGRIDHEIDFVNLANLISQSVDLKIIKIRKLNTKSDPTKNISTIIEKAHNLKEIHMRCLPSEMENSIKSLSEDESMKNIKFYYNSNATLIDDENKLGQIDKEMIERMKKLEESDKYPLNVIR